MSVVISDLSTVFIKTRIMATKDGNVYNPTSDVVEVAFKAPGTDPATLDWQTASWETAGTNVFYARLLVGPAGGYVLPTGSYRMWIRVKDNPETPVMEAPGTIRIS